MKVLLIKDVYKLGRAGDVKKVADGYGRNFLIPQNLAVLATPGALKQAERIRQKATESRAILNEEMSTVAEQLTKVQLTFGARAGETGKLYGSITSQDIANALQDKTGFALKRQQLDMQPLRMLGEHIVRVRLTMDLIPEIKVTVFREGEAEPSLPIEPEPIPEEKTGKAKPVKAESAEAGESAAPAPAAEVKEKKARRAKSESTEAGESPAPAPAAEVKEKKARRTKAKSSEAGENPAPATEA